MTSQADPMRARFWRELSDLRTGMLGRDAQTSQPMTAHFDEPGGAVWFIARRDSPLARHAGAAVFTYTARGHDLYACITGTLSEDPDRSVLDRFWTAEVARWFADQSAATLLRFEPQNGEAWIPGESADGHPFRFGEEGRRAASA